MALQDDLDSALADAVCAAGSQVKFAGIIGSNQSTVHDWLRRGDPLPAEHVLKVEAATGVSRHDLRPDIYPIELTGAGTPASRLGAPGAEPNPPPTAPGAASSDPAHPASIPAVAGDDAAVGPLSDALDGLVA